MRPCPWCILQRVLYVLIAVAALLAAATRRPLRTLLAGVVLLLAAGGVAAAVYQHEVASKQYSCALTFADQVLTTLGIEKLWPAVFQVTATCAEAAVSVLGVPFEYWSLALYLLVGLAAARVLFARREAPRAAARGAPRGSELGAVVEHRPAGAHAQREVRVRPEAHVDRRLLEAEARVLRGQPLDLDLGGVELADRGRRHARRP